MAKYISIDIGGTAIKYGLIEDGGKQIEKKERKTEAHKGGPSILEKIVEIVDELKTEDTAGVCISTAGIVDTKKRHIY